MKAWGMTPRQWREQSPDDRALMMAFEMFEGVRESYRQEWREENQKDGGKKDNRRNEFEAMKRRMAV